MTSLTDIDTKQTKQAVRNALAKYFAGVEPVEDPEGKSEAHMVWMLNRIISEGFNATKSNRWLGFVQAWLVINGKCTLEDVKDDIRAVKNPPRVALPNHLTYCDEDCKPGACSESHKRRESVAAIDTEAS